MQLVTSLEKEKVLALRNALVGLREAFPAASQDSDTANEYKLANFLWTNIFPIIDQKIERIDAFGRGFHRPTWELPDVPTEELRTISLEQIINGTRVMSAMLNIPWN